MKIENYTFTHYMPSANPFLWYADNTGKYETVFMDSITTSSWLRQPRFGDKIELHKDDVTYDLMSAFINGEKVFERTEETDRIEKEKHSSIYEPMKQKIKNRLK